MTDYEYDDDLSGEDRAYMEAMDRIEGYCELCDSSGHTVSGCPTRDDEDYYYDD